MGKQWKQRQTLFSWAPRSLQMVTAAVKLKDACSLEDKHSILKRRDITLPTKVCLVKAMVFPIVVYGCEFSSVQFSHSVVSNSLRPHELQHARPPCPSPTPRVHLNPRPSSRWSHPTISSSVVPFSSCPQSFPILGSFQMSQLVALGGQNIGVSASNISPSNEYPGLISFRMDWLDLLAVQGTLKSLFQHHSSKASILHCSALFKTTLTSIHDYWKNHSLD